MDKKQCVTKLGKHDVLMGRGAFATDYEGNLRLRETVLERYHDYAKTSRRSDKHTIAKQIVQSVLDLGGRFLRCDTSTSNPVTNHKAGDQDQAVNLPSESNPWYVVTDQSILCTKVKQLLRDAGKDSREKFKRLNGKGGGVPCEILSTAASPKSYRVATASNGIDDHDEITERKVKRAKPETQSSSILIQKTTVGYGRGTCASFSGF